MVKTSRIILIAIVSFALYYAAFKQFEGILSFIDASLHQRFISYLITYIVVGIPIFSGTCLINRDVWFFQHLGLTGNILMPLLMTFLFSLPMFLGALLFYKIRTNIIIENLIAKTLFAGFFEELYFRGFLFGQLFRHTRLGFILSIVVGAIIFASGHLFQSQDTGELIGIFGATFAGAILFAWLFVEWNYNLWVPILLHTFMNLSWEVFAVSDNALGPVNANLFRGLTVAAAIISTIIYKKRKMSITRKNVFIKQ